MERSGMNKFLMAKLLRLRRVGQDHFHDFLPNEYMWLCEKQNHSAKTLHDFISTDNFNSFFISLRSIHQKSKLSYFSPSRDLKRKSNKWYWAKTPNQMKSTTSCSQSNLNLWSSRHNPMMWWFWDSSVGNGVMISQAQVLNWYNCELRKILPLSSYAMNPVDTPYSECTISRIMPKTKDAHVDFLNIIKGMI